MPTYEFRCPDGTIVERIFKMSEAPQTIPNPNGEGEAVRIISGGAALLFKGSGFYITDYGKDGKKDQRSSANESAASVSSAPKADGAKTEGSKSDSGKSDSGKSDSAKPAAPAAPSTPSPSTKSDS
jgi:predicted nucleic acid-binding Zn ribbon protein